MAQRDSFEKATRVGEKQEEGRNGGGGGKIEWELSEGNTRAVSGRQNDLIGEFKMAAGDVISIREQRLKFSLRTLFMLLLKDWIK